MFLHLDLLAVLLLGVVAGTLGGVIGFGSSIMLMPVLVILFGPREAVPIMAVAALLANASRALVWWREVDWRAFAAYSATGVPAAALGASTLLTIPQRWIEIVMGLFFLAVIPARRWLARRNLRINLWQLALAGALVGYITGIVVSTGPINAPFFLALGLVKGAYLATEALGSLAVYASKAIVFRSFGALPMEIILQRPDHRQLADGRLFRGKTPGAQTEGRTVQSADRRLAARIRTDHAGRGGARPLTGYAADSWAAKCG